MPQVKIQNENEFFHDVSVIVSGEYISCTAFKDHNYNGLQYKFCSNPLGKTFHTLVYDGEKHIASFVYKKRGKELTMTLASVMTLYQRRGIFRHVLAVVNEKFHVSSDTQLSEGAIRCWEKVNGVWKGHRFFLERGSLAV